MRFLTLYLLLIPFTCITQIQVTDSLLTELKYTSDQKEQSLLYTKIAKSYQFRELDSAVYYANKGYSLAKELSYDIGMAENLAALGDFNITNNQLEEARINYSSALKYFEDDEHLFDFTQIKMILGNIQLAQDNYVDALINYQDCLDNAVKYEFNDLLPHLYNNIGNLYQEIGDYEDAQENYLQAYSLFSELEDKYSAAITLSNISNIKNIMGDSKEAIIGYLDVIRIFSEVGSNADKARIYNLISDIYIDDNKFQKAKEYQDIALNLIEDNKDDFDGPLSIFESEIYTTAAKLFYHRKEFENSISYAKKALNLSYNNLYKVQIIDNSRILSDIYDQRKMPDSALKYFKVYTRFNEEFQNENDLKRITQLKMQYEFDEILKQREIDEIKRQADYKRKEVLYIGIMVVSILGIVIVVLLFLNQKSKTAKIVLKKENLELEKEKLNQDIEYKKKELASNMMYLVEKNEFLAKLARQLVELKPSSKKDNQNIIQGLINELKLNSNAKVWDDFELRFKEVHSDFYDALYEAFPDLSPNEIKICAFLRLNMSTKEISSITHQSVKSINMARFRLRKKLNMDRDENLIAFLTQL